MVTAQEQRRIRLANDYASMLNLKRDWLQWKKTSGLEPHVEGYELDVKIRTIISGTPSYRERHTITVSLGPDYPNGAPIARMATSPPPFHPNWYSDGRWCFGHWDRAEGLGEYVIRMIQTLQFNKFITNEGSAANGTANAWYMERKGSRLFPCDTTPLPDPTTSRVKIRDQNQGPNRAENRLQIKTDERKRVFRLKDT